jgi:two-component system, OmpR family, response regulator
MPGGDTMRVLLVEDDPMIGASIQQGLRQEGWTIDWVQDGAAVDGAVRTTAYTLVLLDLGLPHRSGCEILATLRRRGNPVPVVILTARDAVADRIRGLDSGADDYLVKPFDLNELAARLRAVLRRQSGRADPVIRHGPLMLDPTTHEVTWHGAAVTLSGREFAVLQALLERPGAVLSRTQLEERLYGWEDEVASNAIEVHISHLRHKLAPAVVRTVRGVGYLVPKTPV